MLLRFDRFAMSVLASVVSDGSPGSSLLMLVPDTPSFETLSASIVDRVLGRLAGGFIPSTIAVDFFGLKFVLLGAAESPASSPEASREEGWSRSAVEDWAIDFERVDARFRFPEPEDDGEDMTDHVGAGESVRFAIERSADQRR